MKENKKLTLQKENQQRAKKVWKKPEIEIIDTGDILSGNYPGPTEGQPFISGSNQVLTYSHS